MFRKLSETFTATHFTILAGIAMIVPGALYGAVATTAVSITDPGSGAKSLVDGGRRLWTYDTVAGYRNSPANFVHFERQCGATYVPPSGKGLIVTDVVIGGEDGSQGALNTAELYNDGSQNEIAYMVSVNSAASENFDLGSGALVHAGESLKVFCDGFTQGFVTVNGYVLPASALPAPGSAEANAQLPHGSARHRVVR